MNAMDTPREPTVPEIAATNHKERARSDQSRVPSRVYAALKLLLESHAYAEDLGGSPWDFAVEMPSLRELGITNSDVRWLVAKQLLDHAREITMPGEERRSFQQCNHLTLSKKTCFVLTAQGLDFARHNGNGADELPRAASSAHDPMLHFPQLKARNGRPAPVWDRDRQELRVGDQVVKQFKVPATNQETILAAFQEEHWPPRIDDPLPPQKDQDPKRRLHDTINSLNRNQKRPLLRFLGDGSGQGVRWEFADDRHPRSQQLSALPAAQ
jgi:hypothetical protein